MRILFLLCSLLTTCCLAQPLPATPDPATMVWYDRPAANWQAALPVGNGRLGGMVFGTVAEERIQLNEETLWSGGPYSTVVPGGAQYLKQIQQLVFDERYLEAHNLFGRKLMGYPVEQQKYQSLGNLHLFFANSNQPTQYKRWLDLTTGIAGVHYESDGVAYDREVFSSAPDQVLVVRLTASKPGALNFVVNLRGVRNQAHSNYATDYFQMDPYGDNGLILKGKSADYMGVAGKLRYEGRVLVINEGGTVRAPDVNLVVEGANAVTLYFAAATNFVNYQDVSADEHQRVEKTLKALAGKTYATIRSAAVADYQRLFSRVKLTLPVTANSQLPTDERMKKIQESPDPALAALGYQFGRYLLISSSRPGTEPANLQGIWNDDQNPMWDSKYTTNINTEMNYWPAESGNLSECTEPLFRMIRELTDQGSKVAREHYGAGGWVFHQNTDLWRVAAPMDGPTWGTFTVGGAWLSTHLWEHYQYTQDKAFLAEAYPLLEGSVKFFMDFLVPHPRHPWLVTNPSTSPENFPDGGGNKPYFDEVTAGFREGTTICAGSSIDMQILYDLFGYFDEASTVLHKQSTFIDAVRSARSKLVPPQIGKDGALQEWADDWKSLEKNHRHFSHLYGLYPGKVLSDLQTPALTQAYRNVLEERGDGAAGWSRAWKMALWARLYDGNRANKIFKGYLKEQSCPSLFALCGRALQVDGSLGLSAAVAEMLVQSHRGQVELLPSLPDEWADGAVQGLVTRGAFELDLEWRNRRVTKGTILSKAGVTCRLKAPNPVVITSGKKRVPVRQLPGQVIEFQTVAGARYTLTPGPGH